MHCLPLSSVANRFSVGVPLPFNIRNADGTLLLALGQVIGSDAQLEALLDRGAIVDGDDLRAPPSAVARAGVAELPSLWAESVEGVGRALRGAEAARFVNALEDAARPVLELLERDPDLAIFQVLRQELGSRAQYGVAHSVHTGITAFLAAQRLGWAPEVVMVVFKASLTMNLAALELHGQLATQVTPPSPAQRAALQLHPQQSVELLQEAGVTDRVWLDAVAQHHELPGGKGYPRQLQEVSPAACLVRHADIYTAKLSPRVKRSPQPANVAARELYLKGREDPMVAAIVKEFGVYPPGCHVELASGEMGVVIKRGSGANTPIVASLTNRHGEPLIEPIRRDCALPAHAIRGVISEHRMRVRVSPEKLVVMASG